MMAKRSASRTPTDRSSQALDDNPSNAAQQQLDALRRTVESRLAALEEVLADPSRGESLPGLILELSRAATEEAQAAASQVGIAARAEADKEIAALRSSAKAALDAVQASLKSAQASLEQEQAVGADLRRVMEQAALKSHKQAELLAALEQLEAGLRADRERLEEEVVRQQAIAVDLQRGAGDLKRAATDAQQQLEKERRSSTDWQSQLEAERAAGAQQREGAETAVGRSKALERDLADERLAHEAAVADLTEARAAVESQRAAVEAQRAAVEAERAAGAQQRQAAETAVAQLKALERDLADERSAHEAAVADLTEVRAALEAERAASAQQRQAAETAVARLTSLERDLADERSAHEAAVADLTEVRAAHEAAVAELTEMRASRDAGGEDLARARNAAAEREHAEARWQSELEAERATVADLRQAAARAEELRATLARESSKSHEANEEAVILQKSLAEARKALAAAQAELEAEYASMAELRQSAEYTDQQLASARSNEAQAVADHQKVAAQLDALARERESITDELTAARKWINELRDAEAEFALPPAPPHVDPLPAQTSAGASTPPQRSVPDAPPASPPASKPASQPDPRGEREPEEGWQAVRLASRYLFNEGVMVQVNGDPARLFDISISGCQVLSPTALKPNQIVKVLLASGKAPVHCVGKVVWTRLEPMAAGEPLGYRAGVRFSKADEAGIEKFAARHASPA
jgi:chromosome segregation ATPase